MRGPCFIPIDGDGNETAASLRGPVSPEVNAASTSSGRNLLPTVLYWAVPPCLLLLLFYRGLWCWFFKDDIALLQLASLPDREFWSTLWQPRGQGTLRPLSERLYAYYLYQGFGLNAFPYRVVVFATQIVNLWLLARVARRLTGSRTAGLLAACFWALHHSLSTSLTWTSAYNQVLCATFFLVGFGLFLRFVRSGKPAYYVAQWVAFLLGFGALETMLAYPGILLAYTLLFARRYSLSVLPMFLGSAGLAWLQWQAGAPLTEGIYQPAFDGSLLSALGTYTGWALAAKEPLWMPLAVGIPLLILIFHQAYRGKLLGLFFAAWFVVSLSPYLPFVRHLTEYYLVIPVIGLAMLGAWACVLAWKAGWSRRAAFAAGTALFLFASITHIDREVGFHYRLSHSVKQLVSDVAQARARHPQAAILLNNVTHHVFYASIYHEIFLLVGIFDVYLTPDSSQIQQMPGYSPIEGFFLSPADTLAGLERRTIVVYDASGPRLTDITEPYRVLAPLKLGQ